MNYRPGGACWSFWTVGRGSGLRQVRQRRDVALEVATWRVLAGEQRLWVGKVNTLLVKDGERLGKKRTLQTSPHRGEATGASERKWGWEL